MEGATVVHVTRLAAGQGIYVRPSLDFVPFGYPALYYYVCLPVAWIIGSGFTALRLLSIGATVATLLCTYAIVKRTSGAAAGLAAVGAFAGAYGLSDGWYDLGRVDALYVAALASVYLTAIRATTPRSWAICGVLAAAAFAVKQPAVLAVAPLGLYLMMTDRRGALAFLGTFAVAAAGTFVAMNVATGGWYSYYVFDLPRLRMSVSSGGERALSFWTEDLLPVGFALIAGSSYIARARAWRHGAIVAGLVGTAWLARLEGGAWNNAVMPAYLAAAVLLGLSLHPDSGWTRLRWSLAGVQLCLLIFDPRPFRPTPEARAQGGALVQELRTLPQPLLVMSNVGWAASAGLTEHAHSWAVTDVVWADRGEIGLALEREIQTALRGGAFATIITDDHPSWFREDLSGHYREAGSIPGPVPPSGAPRRPAIALRKK
jgi:4-amino-4-deoxy-L-arabinose transferase-like glycosyltransferase